MILIGTALVTIIVTALAFAGHYCVLALWYFIRYKVNISRFPAYGRDLSQTEQATITQAIGTVKHFRLSRQYPLYYIFLTLWGIMPIGLSVLALGGLVFGVLHIYQQRLIDAANNDVGVIVANFPMSLVAALFLGMIVGAVICIFIARAAPNYMSYLTYEIGWGRKNGGEREDSDIDKDMTHAMRAGALTPEVAEDGRALTRLSFERFTGEWLLGLFVLASVFLYVLSWDIRWLGYVSVQSLYQIQGNMVTVETRDLATLSRVERDCYIKANNNQLEAELEYKLYFADGHSFIIEGVKIAKLVEEVDTSLFEARQAPVNISYSKTLDIQRSDADCVTAIRNGFVEKLHDPLVQAFSEK